VSPKAGDTHVTKAQLRPI